MTVSSNLSRRELFELGALGAVLGPAALANAGAAARPPAESARNIIFMVSDGMSLGTLTLADAMSRRVLGRASAWSELLSHRDVTWGLAETSSLDSMVTDSSAASTAWATGSLVFNGAVGLLPDGTPLTTIAELAREAKRRVGLVTTTTITHATPAGFAARCKSRDDEQAIAPQYLGRVDVLMGGGLEFYLAETRADQRDLIEEHRKAGYAFWNTREQVSGPDRPTRVLGLFNKGHLPYSVDHLAQPAMGKRVPTLAEMTRKALQILESAADGFLLQVEGGRVDHAAHNNDAAALLRDQLAFDEAVAAVREFAAQRDDTLVVITTDHGNSNPGLVGMGGEYRRSTQCFERLFEAGGSYEELLRRLRADGGDRPTPDAVRDAVRAHLNISLKAEEAEAVAAALREKYDGVLNRQFAKRLGVLGQALANHTGIGWTGMTHTADFAVVTAFGAGAERFAGVQKNTETFRHLTALLGVSHTNPSMTPEAAQRYLAARPPTGGWRDRAASAAVHWI